MQRLLMIVALFLGSFTVQAEMTDLGPAVGSKIPHMLELKDQYGKDQSFDMLKGEKGAVITFYRSADWCPYCQMQLVDLNMNAAKDIADRGYSLIGVSYDDPEKLMKFTQKWKVSYPLLSDKGSVAIDAFGIRNEQYGEDSFAHGVPHPIVLVVGADGTVKQKLFEEGFRKRPPTDVIIKALDDMM